MLCVAASKLQQDRTAPKIVTSFVCLSPFDAVASLYADGGGASCVGGSYNKRVHSPPGDASPSHTIHIAMSIYIRGNRPAFNDLKGFKVWKETNPVDADGVPFTTTVNHFVPVRPAPAPEVIDLADVSSIGAWCR